MARPRDSQRKRVYTAEGVLRDCAEDREIRKLKELQEYVDELVSAPWFRERWPHVESVAVRDGRGRKRAGGSPLYGTSSGEITMPKRMRTTKIVLHELAHVVAPVDEAWHGKRFCGCFARLVYNVMGENAFTQLTTSFRTHRVKYVL